MEITAKMVGELRDMTGAGMMDCKKALVDAEGNMDKAAELLRERGIAKAAKKHGKLLEINNSSLKPGGSRIHVRENDLTLLEHCKHYEVPVIMGSDAHFMNAVGVHDLAISVIEEAGFPEDLVANTNLDLLAKFIPALNE